MEEIIAYIAVFAACLARTTMPMWYKNKGVEEEQKIKFEAKYLGTLVSAIVASFVLANLMFPLISLPDPTVTNLLGFTIVFTAAWGMNDLMNKLLIDAWRPNE